MDAITADLLDTFGDELTLCQLALRDFGGVRCFSGPIATVKVREDNLRIVEMLDTPGEGRVLVIDGQGAMGCALVGDILGAKAVANGWAGFIVNAAIRDVAGLAKLTLGVKGIAPNPRKPSKTGDGETQKPVTFGGITFTPGEWVYADEDGVVVSKSHLTLP